MLKSNPAQVGSFISKKECNTLIADFKTHFPDEVSSVVINKELISNLLQAGHVSGIRFLYGLQDMNDASSRVIFLLPCNYTGSKIPNVIFSKGGIMMHNGELASLDRACRMQINHVLKLKNQTPNVPYTKIMRGYFLGKENLLELVRNTSQETVVYNLGYDASTTHSFKPVIQGWEEESGLDHGDVCPPYNEDGGCGGDQGCVATYVSEVFAADADGQLDILRTLRDEFLNADAKGAAIEKYYMISTSLMERLKNDSQQSEVSKVLYHQYFKSAVNAVLQNDKTRAFELFEDCMNYMIEKYLYQ